MKHTINAIRFILEHIKKHGDSVDVRKASTLLDNFNEEMGGLEQITDKLPQASVEDPSDPSDPIDHKNDQSDPSDDDSN